MTSVETRHSLPFEAHSRPASIDIPEVERVAGLTSLRSVREERDLSTVDLARLAGLTRDEIVSLENGAPFTAAQLHALSAALNVPIETLTT